MTSSVPSRSVDTAGSSVRNSPQLVVIETHPIQYHAPVYRMLQAGFGVPVTVIYGSDFSVAGSLDVEFGASFAWDTDLLSGYTPVFLSRVATGGARQMSDISAGGLGRALRNCDPAAILLTGYSPRFHQAAFCQARRIGRPILFRGETTDHAARRSPLKTWARDAALRYLYRSCSKLLYVGQRSRDHLLRLGCAEDKLAFSPYCVDTEPFHLLEEDRLKLRDLTRHELAIEPDHIVILFSGKLSFRKGPDLLVEAVKALPEALRSRIVVLFLGSGEMRAELDRAAASEPRIAVRFAGFQNQRHLSPYFHAADLLVLPSRWSETWGLVVNEALHHGLPCLVSDAVGCMPDLVRPAVTGEPFAAGSIDSMLAAIQRLMPLVGRRETRDICRDQVRAYSVQNAASGIAQAYHSVVQVHD